MDEKQMNEEQGVAQDDTNTNEAANMSKGESLKEMTKTLPDWSLEPPETFLV